MTTDTDQPTTTKPRCSSTFTALGSGFIIACQACGWADVAGNLIVALSKAETHDGRTGDE